MKTNAIHRASALFVFAAICMQSSMAAEPAQALYEQCKAKNTTAEQRACYPDVVKQSELELVAAEKEERARMAALEAESEGSRSLHPVMAFDKAERAYRAFRTAEARRVLTRYGSGNGGGLASYQTTIEMNLARTKLLKNP